MENRRVYKNNKNNLLQLEEHMYPMVDVDTPNVFRNLFPYDEVLLLTLKIPPAYSALLV